MFALNECAAGNLIRIRYTYLDNNFDNGVMKFLCDKKRSVKQHRNR